MVEKAWLLPFSPNTKDFLQVFAQKVWKCAENGLSLHKNSKFVQ